MYKEYFYIYFCFTILCFFYSLLAPNLSHKQIFSILCIPLFIGLAVGSLSIENVTMHVVGTEVVEHTNIISSVIGAYIFAFFALISTINLYRYYLEEKNNARNGL